MGLPRVQGYLEKFLLHLGMAVTAVADHVVFADVRPVDLILRMAFEAVFAALGHRIGVGDVALDAPQHRFMPGIFVNRRDQRGVAGHAVPGAGEQRRRYKR